MLTPAEQQNLAAIDAFFAATNLNDVAAMTALTTPDVLFENTSPAPDGERIMGQAAFARFFADLFERNRYTQETPERIVAAGDYCTVQWRYEWIAGDGTPGHIRGMTLFRLEDGKIAEHINYVKG